VLETFVGGFKWNGVIYVMEHLSAWNISAYISCSESSSTVSNIWSHLAFMCDLK